MDNFQSIPYDQDNFRSDIPNELLEKLTAEIGKYWKDAENFFGLPYTSSGAFAGVWNTNAPAVFESKTFIETIGGAFSITNKENIDGFTITLDGRAVLLTSFDDKDGNEQNRAYEFGRLFPEVKTIDVQAKEYFDKTYGNIYFAGKVTINFGTETAETLYIPFQYGYGSSFEDAAKRILQDHGALPIVRKFGFSGLSTLCREFGIILRTNKQENCKKRDVKAYGSGN